MKKYLLIKIALLLIMFVTTLSFLWAIGWAYRNGREIGYEEGYETSEEGKKTWSCFVVKDCPWRDWRYTKGIDVCEFEFKIMKAKENPVGYTKEKPFWHGQYCEEIN